MALLSNNGLLPFLADLPRVWLYPRRVHRFPLLTLSSLLDNELSNYRHAFSSPFSLSLSSPFSSNTSFSQTSKLRKVSNFFLLFFFFPRDEREKYYIGSQNEVSTAGWEYVGLRFAGHLAVDEQSSGDRGPGRK